MSILVQAIHQPPNTPVPMSLGHALHHVRQQARLYRSLAQICCILAISSTTYQPTRIPASAAMLQPRLHHRPVAHPRAAQADANALAVWDTNAQLLSSGQYLGYA